MRDAGGRLQAIAADLPEPPAVHRPAGSDPLSAAIAAKVTEVVDPVIAQMPIAKQALTEYAKKVIDAAGVYDAADRQLAEEVRKRVSEFDETFGGGGSGGASSSAGSTARAGGSPTVAAAKQGGQIGSMVQMPMQMAGTAGSAPQALQQGAQQTMQQIGRLSDMTGVGEPKSEEANAADNLGARPDEGAAGVDTGEGAPAALTPPLSQAPEQIRPGPETRL
ncbi:hypothetical protein [Mycobacterium sp. IDR2000157661]|uniref:hypothetical protein n=1 Tax=Mycobacterium sp. IDR2000157661 TaxID=2867005 RepID=UPI001EEF72A7|nr:hypothetical protein [Mycobacterium sp. IDR2000157661]ULE34601.1 hypothetical protein K3G64_08360 [Mycobacterium sp. IDR2000157661]